MNKAIITKLAILFVFWICFGCSVNEQKNKKDNWIWLFQNGDTGAWRSAASESFPKHGWLVEQNVLTVLGKNDSLGFGTDIITKAMYSNFELELEYKLSEGGNSGIKYVVSDSFPGYEGKFLGLEFQLIDNDSYPESRLGKTGNRKLGSLYDLIPAPEIEKINPPGEWNKARLIVDGKHVEHWLNGQKILAFERGSDSFRALVARSKYANYAGFGEAGQGHILLQWHSTKVSFRNIRIRTW